MEDIRALNAIKEERYDEAKAYFDTFTGNEINLFKEKIGIESLQELDGTLTEDAAEKIMEWVDLETRKRLRDDKDAKRRKRKESAKSRRRNK